MTKPPQPRCRDCLHYNAAIGWCHALNIKTHLLCFCAEWRSRTTGEPFYYDTK